MIASPLSSYPGVTMMAVSGFITKCNILDDVFISTDVDRLFIASKYQMPENPKFSLIGNALVRFEFWELLVRISSKKYFESGQVKTPAIALEKLIKEKLIPHAQPEPW